MKYSNNDNFANNESFDLYKSDDKGSELCFNECGYEKCSKNHFWEGKRNFYLFHYVLNGKGILSINGNDAQSICKGQCFFITPEDHAYYIADEQSPWEYIWIGFSGMSARGLMKRCGLVKQPVQDVKNEEQLLSLYKEIISNSRKGEYANLLVLAVIYKFVVYLLDNYRMESDGEYTQTEQNFRKIIKVFEANYKTEMDIDKIAKSIGYEKTYVYRLFKKYLGMPPKQYIAYLRLYDALQQIKFNSDERIDKIATEVGFNDYVSFYRAFKKFINMSPEEYRMKLKDGSIERYHLKEMDILEKKIEQYR